ncbi:response regulator transcription factor [Aminipila luticellarii]|uniref:Stage 0 sporulation protein A homolog n=1 Tax=Aminipila luticellarii TaxID=2507160 RepID=A0A410PT67_9FIRM|nr:response regulator transcription factor [Aminipila luticellarii]QAT42162.1 response regulator transcription factor [Aminipila luticellarii]
MKVLVIEDDKSIAELERDYLEINGYECDIASDGLSGLDLALKKEYALIILDIMLPGIDGFELCARFREQSDTPVILLSARKEDIDKVRGLGLGADDYMTKPFSPNELMARVKSHIARYDRLTGSNKAGQNRILKIRELEIDKDSRRVFINGEEKIMPAKEYDLLLFLAENPNRVFSKEHIFDRIWGLDAIGDVSTVTVHIRRLREKIETDMDNLQYIETVWGVGYRFKG